MYTMKEIEELREVRPYNRAKERNDRLFLDDIWEIQRREVEEVEEKKHE
jgi:hypothetical protein